MTNKKFNILGVAVDAVNLDLAAQTINNWVAQKQKTYVCVAPVSTIVECQHDGAYKNVVNAAGMVTPDGMPVVWFGRLKGFKVERTYGPDLMLKVCREGVARDLRHYFFGGTTEVLARLESRLKKECPGITIGGMFSPPFIAEARKEGGEFLAQINVCQPDIIWVGLGAPKQDFWMHLNREGLQAPVLVGVGAAFDFLSGAKKQAPAWMQKSGLEWFFRLCSEPRRLWKRYLVGNTQFLYYLVKDAFRKA